MIERHLIKNRECSRVRQKKYSKCRNKGLDPNSSIGIGYITEILVARYLEIDTCFKITDNFNYPKYDMFEYEDWGLINVKGCSKYIYEWHGWCRQPYWAFFVRKNTKPDFFFCIGYDYDRKDIECVYIIPNEEYVSRLEAITILEFGYSKYDRFEEDSKPWNDLYHNLKLDNCPVLMTGK